jgi:hypothetical protein
MVHVSCLSNGLPRSTALFYFNSKKDMDQALALKDSLSYQGRRVYLSSLDQKTYFACGSADHEVKTCKIHMLRYPLRTTLPTSSKLRVTKSSQPSSGRSYASAVKSSVSTYAISHSLPPPS